MEYPAINAKSLGFKFSPGDRVRVIGQQVTTTVMSCTLQLVGRAQAVKRTYELAMPESGIPLPALGYGATMHVDEHLVEGNGNA